MWRIQVKEGDIVSVEGSSRLWTDGVPPSADNSYLLWWANVSPTVVFKDSEPRNAKGSWFLLKLFPADGRAVLLSTLSPMENLFFWLSDGTLFSFKPLPKAILEILREGGLVPYVKRRGGITFE